MSRHFLASDFFFFVLTRPNCALDSPGFQSLYVFRFQRQVFNHVKVLSEQSKKMKEQKKEPREHRCCGIR